MHHPFLLISIFSLFPNFILNIIAGKFELFTKHDHTQYKLLASAEDPNYKPSIDLKYISLASFNNTPIQLFYDCNLTSAYIDTQIATKYASAGNPLLLADPPFTTFVDKRNCKSLIGCHRKKMQKINFKLLNRVDQSL